MSLETGTYISDLIAMNPLGNDPRSEGDDHIRLLKAVLKATFPNINGAVNPTPAELNYLVGVTSAIQTQIDSLNALKAAIAGQAFTGPVSAPSLSLASPLPIASGGTGGATAAAGFANIKQQADTVNTGVTRFATIAEALNWSASPLNTVACTPASLAGTRAFAINGFQRFPGGLLIQWGQSASITVDTNVTLSLPMAFPTSVIIAFCCTQNSDTGNDDVFARLLSVSTTQITMRAEGTSGATSGVRYLNYLAIGY